MDILLNTRRVLVKAPDVRIARRATILQELRTPERLTEGALRNLFNELAEIQADLEKNPPETKDEEE